MGQISSPAFWAAFRPQNWPHAAYFLKGAETEGYKKGPIIWAAFLHLFALRLRFLFGETKTIWQLASDAMVSLPAHKNPLLIKLGESSIFWFYGLERGHIIGPATRASRKEMQGAMGLLHSRVLYATRLISKHSSPDLEIQQTSYFITRRK